MSSEHETGTRIAKLTSRLAALERERAAIIADLAELRRQQETRQISRERSCQEPAQAAVTMKSSAAEKIAVFRGVFRGREDVFPRRWDNPKTGKSGYSPACDNEWISGICGKPKIKCGECPNQAFPAVSDAVISSHLRGKDVVSTRRSNEGFVAGVYPLLRDETCWFLAADFDKQDWQRDARAFLTTCREKGVPAVLERSRSGSGGHVWIFFSEPVPAAEARRLGSFLVTETMERCPDIGFDSYDRFFPSQDTMPAGGFGNLIALPLQNAARRNGNSVFVDDDFQPYEDQWAFLASVRRMTRAAVTVLIEHAAASGRVLGVRIPIDDDNEEPWAAPPSRRRSEPPVAGNLPDCISLVVGNQIYLDRNHIPPGLANRLIRLAAFQNPEFYAAQAMRLPTFGKPRIISCAELFAKHIALPRGCLDDAIDLLAGLGIKVDVRDERQQGTPLGIQFIGELTLEQEVAAGALLAHDTGVLAATTAFGKTVVAANLIARRSRNTLVLVHRQQLLDQWAARLQTFLDIGPARIGVIGGGKRKPKGDIDIALIQSLSRRGDVLDLVGDYGHLVVDECHHLSAVSFEAIARAAKARFVLGLSATVTRKDGHHPIIFMQCGPIRHRVDSRRQAAARPFSHKVVHRRTDFHSSHNDSTERVPIQDLYRALASDESRNAMIFDDVLTALEAGRSPVVLTERKDHLTLLAERLARFAKNVIVLRGGMNNSERRQVMEAMATVPEWEERVLLATGRYLGEGFDDPRLDTLFLTMPISWRGTLAQYAGRLHRLHPTKRQVVIFDYVDGREPVFAKMSAKRDAGYASLGYETADREDALTGISPRKI